LLGQQTAPVFGINRIELFFGNRRAETTDPKLFPNIKSYAEIRYTGSGVLDGFWEVDGRLIRGFQILTFGLTVTLRTPEIPAMPTFDPGSNIVVESAMGALPLHGWSTAKEKTDAL
jgi:hypothetical protein